MTKTENEFLREKNDTLFKLGRMALQKKKEPELEIVKDNDEDGLDALVNNQKTGFRRAGPATYAEKVNQDPTKKANSEREKDNIAKLNTSPLENKATNGNAKYCHFFSNFGRCHFEEKAVRK